MRDHDATEAAYKNGRAAGFADGIAAAGIAPVQWRSVRDVPLPDGGDVILWTADGDYRAGQIAHSRRFGFVHLITDRYGGHAWIRADAVTHWSPVQKPEDDA